MTKYQGLGLYQIDREAITVESSTLFKKPVKIYVIEPGIMNDWNVHRT